MEGRVLELLERGVLALEKQVRIVEEEVQNQGQEGVLPSECPICGKTNPTVTQLRLGSGPVDDFVLVGETHCCDKTVFAVPVQMLIVPNIEAVTDLQSTLKGGNHDHPR